MNAAHNPISRIGSAMLAHEEGMFRMWRWLVKLNGRRERSAHRRTPAVRMALEAVRHGKWRSAQYVLDHCDPRESRRDAEHLNLLGVIAERQGDRERARSWYGAAIRVDRRFEPAQQNMRRLFELRHFGSSREPYAVGDSLIDLLLASGRLGGVDRENQSSRQL